MIRQMTVPVEILNVKIDVSFKCRMCGSVIRKLTVEKEAARCNKCQSKTKACLDSCKMKVNVIHSQNYFEVELSSQTITQFVKNLVKSQGKSRSEWMNINYWPTWNNKKVDMVLRLSETKWSCIGIMELEEDLKPVPNPQMQDADGRIFGQSEDIGFEDREVKVEEVEEPDGGLLQMEKNTNVQGEEQAEGREKIHENGSGMRVDEAVVRNNQRSKGGERERPVSPKIEDVELEEDVEHRRIPEDFDDGGLRGYDDMDMDYDDIEEGEGRQRNFVDFDDGDLSGEDDMDMDLDLGTRIRNVEDHSNASREELEESDSHEGEESSGDDSDSDQESEGDSEDEEEEESDEEPEQKQTKRRSVVSSVERYFILSGFFQKVTRWFKHERYLMKKRGIIEKPKSRKRFDDRQIAAMNRAFERNQHPNKKQRKPVLAETGLTDDQVRCWFRTQRYRISK
ncbi:hypothetical protein CRE_21393 [Caenorhabditis remanei]|uniref:Homeobox domain-containing protein n=1 Tax=Caenorhabditis remanei TaxID=31234 RepID=E3MUP9_CAERE|nr:hypothetical protein CRE_21393 [Caenorhabditis remanei]